MQSLRRLIPVPSRRILQQVSRGHFSTTTRAHDKPLPPRPVIVEGDITEAFLKGTGPGGQKINKTSSAVQLKHLPTGLVVKCQETRSRSQNRKIARRILSERIEELEKGDQSRTALKAVRMTKKKASKSKKARRKYRKLAEGELAAEEEDGGEDEEGGDGGDVEGAGTAGERQDQHGKPHDEKNDETRPRPD
ncbi:hypothetical protein MBLNU459_g1695t1 [Dothideomycetes sp. NU459]